MERLFLFRDLLIRNHYSSQLRFTNIPAALHQVEEAEDQEHDDQRQARHEGSSLVQQLACARERRGRTLILSPRLLSSSPCGSRSRSPSSFSLSPSRPLSCFISYSLSSAVSSPPFLTVSRFLSSFSMAFFLQSCSASNLPVAPRFSGHRGLRLSAHARPRQWRHEQTQA